MLATCFIGGSPPTFTQSAAQATVSLCQCVLSKKFGMRTLACLAHMQATMLATTCRPLHRPVSLLQLSASKVGVHKICCLFLAL